MVEFDNSLDISAAMCVQQVFAEQAARTPEAIAVTFGDEVLTYRELNEKANRAARALQARGVGPEVLVGLCVERSLELIIGVLAILKAGGAYVPVEPTDPESRVAFILKDAGVRVVLTTNALLDGLPYLNRSGGSYTVVPLDDTLDSHSDKSSPELVRQPQLEDLAYVIYTSGSTGQPKGVAMSHLPLFNLIRWQIHSSALNLSGRADSDAPCKAEKKVTLQFAPMTFDVSFLEIFSTLCSGGTLVLVSEEERRDLKALLNVVLKSEVSSLFLPLIALQHMAEIAVQNKIFPASLREIMTGGEQLQITPAIAAWFQGLPGCTLQNIYGPTEAHVVTTYNLIGQTENWPTLPPIGRPIFNTRIHILDESLQTVPPGAPGELCISGICLARGYFNRPELTDEKFVPNPYGEGRLYRTGDMAYYLPDGNLMFLGRIDDQVKIRGVRVELGEIETLLARHPSVYECAVTAREDLLGGKRLVAYIVPVAGNGDLSLSTIDSGQAVDTSAAIPITRQLEPELYSHLAKHLPDYMVPKTFVTLPSLPVTTSGKVNRNALPAPSTKRPELVTPFVPPDTGAETKVADAWQELLQLEEVGADDNFFELGGHSLLLAHLHTRLEQVFNRRFPIVALFQHPTVRSLSRYLNQPEEKDSVAENGRQSEKGVRRNLIKQRGDRRREERLN